MYETAHALPTWGHSANLCPKLCIVSSFLCRAPEGQRCHLKMTPEGYGTASACPFCFQCGPGPAPRKASHHRFPAVPVTLYSPIQGESVCPAAVLKAFINSFNELTEHLFQTT